MMICIWDENRWCYPDTPVTLGEAPEVCLARGGHGGAQLLTDRWTTEPAAFRLTAALPAGVALEAFQLLPTLVEANSGKTIHVATGDVDREEAVTRRAPFRVLDVTEPVGDTLRPGRVALFLRFRADADAPAGAGTARITLSVGEETAAVSVPVAVFPCRVPASEASDFGVVNWLQWDELAKWYRVESGSARFWALAEAYLEGERDIRCNHLMLPGGTPLRDAEGRVTGFDFSMAMAMGERALAHGFRYIYGGFVARFRDWTEAEQYLLWDREIPVTSLEAYRQLTLYFTALWAEVTRRGWETRWMQCLVDEPQFPNSLSYRALAGICRRWMPGVVIHDPVETTDIPGAVDIWCVKQQVFDRYRDTWKKLQAMGENLWVYTCGYPAGHWMNRATDLSPLAGRLPFWMCAREGFSGFLHWGGIAWDGRDPREHNCHRAGDTLMPPGNGFLFYPGEDGPIPSLRAQWQLLGAEDCELLRQLPPEVAEYLTGLLCRSFSAYETDPTRFAAVRRQVLEALSDGCGASYR